MKISMYVSAIGTALWNGAHGNKKPDNNNNIIILHPKVIR